MDSQGSLPGMVSNVRSPVGDFVAKGFWPGFLLVTCVFFAWALANNLNDILIRQFQKALDLSRAEAGLIQFVFYLAYFLWALPAGLLARRFGYRAGLLAGLGLYALGALLFLPASIAQQYWSFLLALFVLASGAAILETSANPLIVLFGDPARASQRLNLAQAFNGFGALVAPIVGGVFIFSGIEHQPEQIEAMSAAELAAYRASEAAMVQAPYLVLALFVIALALALVKVPLPEVRVAAHADAPASGGRSGLAALLADRRLTGAIVAQFFYVGAQVGIWSFFVDFVKHAMPEVSEKNAAFFLSTSLFAFMLGRFGGTALMQSFSPVRLLFAFAIANVGLLAAAMTLAGAPAVLALGLSSLFMSIMFPTIFALGVKDLGQGAPLGSSLIIMAIIGGAIFPPAMGLISEWADLQLAMVLPLLGFLVVATFAWTQRG